MGVEPPSQDLGDRKPVRVGIIGTGTGLRTLLPSFRRCEHVDVVAIAGSCAERTRLHADLHRVRHAVPSAAALCELDLDLICIASPPRFHVQHAALALRSGANVYLEKPVGANREDVAAIASSITHDHSTFLVVGYQLRFNPHLQAVKAAIHQGLIGRPYHVGVQQQNRRLDRPSDWRTDVTQGGGARLDIGSHLVDLAVWLLEESPTGLMACQDHVSAPGGEASDLFTATLVTHSSTISLFATTASFSGNKFSLVVSGTEGEVHYDFETGAQMYRAGTSERLVPEAIDREVAARRARSIFSTTFTYMAEALVDATRLGTATVPGAATIADAYRTMGILEAAAESHRARCVVELAPAARLRGPGSKASAWRSESA